MYNIDIAISSNNNNNIISNWGKNHYGRDGTEKNEIIGIRSIMNTKKKIKQVPISKTAKTH